MCVCVYLGCRVRQCERILFPNFPVLKKMKRFFFIFELNPEKFDVFVFAKILQNKCSRKCETQTFGNDFENTCVFVTSEGQKMIIFAICFILFCETQKHVYFRNIQIYRNYRVIIGLLFSQNLCFDSDFNRIFNYVHRTHCLTAVYVCKCVY